MPISTISGTITTGISLTSAVYTNPVTITSAAKILTSGGAVSAAGSWTVDNYGHVSSTKLAGINLSAGGVVTNAAQAIISGYRGGVIMGGASGTIENGGLIRSDKGVGVNLSGIGSVTNVAHAVIYGSGGGVIMGGSSGTVVNGGLIQGYYDGITLAAGSITNTGSIISDSGFGIYGTVQGSGPVSINNSGTIEGLSFAVKLQNGGDITNGAGALISGGESGIYAQNRSFDSVVNSGSIYGYRNGMFLGRVGNSVTNTAGASITGVSKYGIFAPGPATVHNAGTITGGKYADAVYLEGLGTNRLIIDPGAVFNGGIKANPGGTNSIELTSGASSGVLSGLGTAVQGFQSLTVDAGAHWAVTGTLPATAHMSGAETGGTVASGGNMIVVFGQVGDSTVNSGGSEFQIAGSTSGATLSGGHAVIVGGAANAIEVSAGGFELAGNFLNAPTGGTVVGSLVHSGGILVMGAHGTADATTIEAGAALFELAGVASSVSLAGTQFVGGGLPGVPPPVSAQPAITSATTVSSGGKQIVNSNGSAYGTVILDGGEAELFAGGIASGASVSSGGVFLEIGGSNTAIAVFAGGKAAQFGGSTSGVALSGALTVVGGVASSVVVASGGFAFAGNFLNAATGGTLQNVILRSGAIAALGVHGLLSGARVAGGGTVFELAGLTENVVLSGGTQFVGGSLPGLPPPIPAPVATASGTVVSAGGSEILNSNGSAVGTNVLSGGEIVFNGGQASGLSLASGAMIDLPSIAFTSSVTLRFDGSASSAGGTLTVSWGTGSQSVDLLGQYVAAGFHVSSDGTGGTLITYGSAGAALAALAASPH
jgi:autotransporter passenger strand-loop-strand repeat protein